MDTYRIIIKTHAYDRFCERVKKVTYSDLKEWFEGQVSDSTVEYFRDGILQVGGVWFGFHLDGEDLTIVTCYGKTTANLPAALKWAMHHNDRINLVTFSGIGVMPP